jgi:hypothetical protein
MYHTNALTALVIQMMRKGRIRSPKVSRMLKLLSQSQMRMLLILLPKPRQFELRMGDVWYCELLLFEMVLQTPSFRSQHLNSESFSNYLDA